LLSQNIQIMTYNTSIKKWLRILLFISIIAVSGVLLVKGMTTEKSKKHPAKTSCSGCPNIKHCEKALIETKDMSEIEESHE